MGEGFSSAQTPGSSYEFDPASGEYGYKAGDFNAAASDAKMFSDLEAAGHIRPWSERVASYKSGGLIDGPSGDDMVPARRYNGAELRVGKGEFILPKRYVSKVGADVIAQDVKRVTGTWPHATLKPSLKGGGMVEAAAAGDDPRRLRMTEEEWARQAKASAIASAPIANVEGNTLPAVGKPQLVARPGWEKENMQFKEPSIDGSPIVSPAKEASPSTPVELLGRHKEPKAPVKSFGPMTKEEYDAQDFGEPVKEYPGIPGIYIQRFDKGTPDYNEYGAAIISNSRRGASKKGADEDIAKYGQGVDGARIYGNAPLTPEAQAALPGMLQRSTAQGRAGLANEAQLEKLAAIRKWQAQPEMWEENGRTMRKAPMPDWVADQMGTARRGESSYDYQMRGAIADAPRRAAAQAQAEAQTAREKQAIAMTPQMMEHYRKAAKDQREAEKDFLENGYQPIKGAPNDLLSGNIASLARGLRVNPLEIQSLLQQIIARDESEYGEIDWTNQKTTQDMIGELNAVAASRFQQ
jgi:hypothetical protein